MNNKIRECREFQYLSLEDSHHYYQWEQGKQSVMKVTPKKTRSSGILANLRTIAITFLVTVLEKLS